MRFPGFTDEWKKTTLGDIVQIVKDKISTSSLQSDTYISTENILPNFAGVNDNCNIPDKQNVTRYKAGDILLANIRPYLKKIWLADRNGGCNADVFVFRPNNINSSFVYYSIANDKFCDYVMSGAKGVKMPRGDKDQILKFETGIPSDEEQQRIVQLLSLIDERIATQNKIIEDLKKLKSAIIDQIIDSSNFPKIRFEELYDKAGEGGTPSTSISEYYTDGTIPFVKIEDLSNKYLFDSKEHITELGLGKSSAWLIPINSILYSNGATIGEISINKTPVCTKQGILGIIPKKEFDVEYLYYFMSSTYFQKQVERIVTEGTMRTAYLKDINHIECPVPDYEKQIGISQILRSFSNKIEIEQRLLTNYIQQKEYLLKSLFI